MSNKENTVFGADDTNSNTSKKNIEFISYVDWFQYVTTKISNFKEESIAKRA